MDQLTKKQQGFVKDYIETGNGTQAALNNYDTEDDNTAAAIASENLTKPKIQIAIKSIAEYIPDELLAQKHLALLNKTDEKGEIDVVAVKAGLDMGYKVKGSYAPDKSVNLNVNTDISSTEDFQELAKRLNETTRSNS